MVVKRIGNIERALIAECVKDIPSFSKIDRLFAMGADPNAINDVGECVLGIVVEGYCSLYGTKLRSGFFVPMLVTEFLENGFNVRRHAIKVISELQNGCYDSYVRKAIKILLNSRRQCVENDCKTVKKCIVTLFHNFHSKKKPQTV